MKNKILPALFLLLSFTATSVGAATISGARQTLRQVSVAATSLRDPVDVRISLEGDTLLAEFEVRTAEINAKKVLEKNEYPYQYDVVELFVSVTGANAKNLPYYEFELSPYDQTFQVIIKDPKKPFIEGVDLGLQHSVKRTTLGWTGEMRIPLKKLGWQGDPRTLTGNAYAILGKSPRSFWSLFLPKQDKPRFHKPEFFKPLL